MARYTTSKAADKMHQSGIVPLFYDDNPDLCKQILHACYKGGARVFEFTNRGSKALENFKALVNYSKEHCEDMALGAGTILSEDDALNFIHAGADFIVSPVLDRKVLERCLEKNILCLPGCFTPSEIWSAVQAGAEVVKLFPADQLGPQFVSAVRAPMPSLKLMPSGGVDVTEESLTAWFQSGVYCVGMGSGLITKEITLKQDFDALEKSVRKVKDIIDRIKK